MNSNIACLFLAGFFMCGASVCIAFVGHGFISQYILALLFFVVGLLAVSLALYFAFSNV
jgi:uncharacterized membrane protein YfcA